jgi:hypothetical protein
LVRAYWNRELCLYLDLFSSEIDVADQSYSDLSPITVAESQSHPVVANIAPTIQAAREAKTRVRAALRSLRVLAAIKGLPEEAQQNPSLSELGLPEDATIDPFNGKPLVMKKVPGGWLVYSVGKNLQDDGGELATFDDVGVGPQKTAEQDPSND